MALLIFHLVLSSITFEAVDVKMAQKIVDWNLKRYPNGTIPAPACSLHPRCSHSLPLQVYSSSLVLVD
jgi:hypothetical protein